MASVIKSVIKKSYAYKKGIKEGDVLLSVNAHPIRDFLDYQFFIKDSALEIEFEHKGKIRRVKIRKDPEEDIGLEFETFLMDKEKRCRNKCIFCFIDQLPKGMRDTLYFKDDDSRLSFLFGNYITLTNLSVEDVQRIIDMHISPVNVSVHTMNKELRVKMMANKNAGECLDYIRQFAENGIKVNTQLVLCPGINDGKELLFSLEELSKLHPGVVSIAAVPVGMTKFREGLFPLEEYTKETAGQVIDIIEKFGDDFKKKTGTRLAYAADEFYLKAEREIPDGEYYEAYSQLENGVGMWASLREEFLDSIESVDFLGERRLSIATGTAAYPLLRELAGRVEEVFPNVKINVYEIVNDFFGHSITVAGLITGGDLIRQLQGKELFEELLIPDVMLRSEGDIFLDDVSLAHAQRQLGVKITPVSSDGYELLSKILKEV